MTLWYQICSCSQDQILVSKDQDLSRLCEGCLKLDPTLHKIFRLDNPLQFSLDRSAFCQLMVIPSKGDFLNDYKTADELHIGILTNGKVIEFDTNGIGNCDIDFSNPKWSQNLPIVLFDRRKYRSDVMAKLNQISDDVIRCLTSEVRWVASNYHETINNCFDFVLAYVNSMMKQIVDLKLDYHLAGQAKEISRMVLDKKKLCENLLVERMRLLNRYVAMHRKLSLKNGR